MWEGYKQLKLLSVAEQPNHAARHTIHTWRDNEFEAWYAKLPTIHCLHSIRMRDLILYLPTKMSAIDAI